MDLVTSKYALPSPSEPERFEILFNCSSKHAGNVESAP
jgi:hypothetical protein